jgi:hypothetical protein
MGPGFVPAFQFPPANYYPKIISTTPHVWPQYHETQSHSSAKAMRKYQYQKTFWKGKCPVLLQTHSKESLQLEVITDNTSKHDNLI